MYHASVAARQSNADGRPNAGKEAQVVSKALSPSSPTTQCGLEKDLVRRIRASVWSDRRAWLDEVLAQKDWGQVRKLKKGAQTTQGRLKDSTGRLVSSELRAETMAEHLEKVQWAVRPASVAPVRPPLGKELPVDVGPFTKQELVTAARAMKHGRASGMDGVPAELWQAVVVDGPGCKEALEICNII